MTALAGFGTPGLLHAAVAILIGHALFKSALFLTVGAVDAIGGTRDLRLLSGVGRRNPLLALAGGMAAASMAGMAPLLGFVTKEAAFAALIEERAWLPLLVVAVASAATVAYSIRFWRGAFGGQADPTVPRVHEAGWWRPGNNLWVAPLSLAALGLALGLAPGTVDRFVSAVSPGAKLVLWPGWKPALAVSAVVLVVGAVMHVFREPIGRMQSSFGRGLVARASSEAAYRGSVSLLNLAADRTTGLIQHGSLPLYLAVILLAAVGAPAAAFLVSGGDFAVSYTQTSAAEIGLALLTLAPAAALLGVRQRMAAVLLLGAVGYAMAGLFILYGAPDLALTLLLVETVVVAIFAFVLARLPRRFEQRTRPIRRVVRATVALAVGSFVTVAALLAGAARPEGPIPSDAYADLAPAAGGKNVVNVILTDFRALDTLGEITVIATAAIGIAALVSGLRTRPRETT
jgi:multicomponent Na+:H+ antiporter subunit A